MVLKLDPENHEAQNEVKKIKTVQLYYGPFVWDTLLHRMCHMWPESFVTFAS